MNSLAVVCFLVWIHGMTAVPIYIEKIIRPLENSGQLNQAWNKTAKAMFCIVLFSASCVWVAMLGGTKFTHWFGIEL